MAISNHRLTPGIGISNQDSTWEPAGAPDDDGFARFDSTMSQMGSVKNLIVGYFNVNISWDHIEPNAPKTITSVTNASPIQITTSTSHGLSTGATNLSITDVGGDNAAAANGFNHTITVTSATTFTIDGSVGDGVYSDGNLHVYDWTLLDDAIDYVCAETGKDGLPYKIGLSNGTRRNTFGGYPAPDWALVAPYEYVWINPENTRRKQLKVWEPAVSKAWIDYQRAYCNHIKDDTRVALLAGTESDPGDASTQKATSGFTDAAYHAHNLAEWTALRESYPLGNITAGFNYYVGGWGGTYYNEALAHCKSLTLGLASTDPIPYAKGLWAYDASHNLHKGIFKYARDNGSEIPIYFVCDDTLFYYNWQPPWQYVIDLPDPFPETAVRHQSFSNGVTLTTPDTAFYYLKHYIQTHFITFRWPWISDVKSKILDAITLYANDFPAGPNPYTGGPPVDVILTEKNINFGGPSTGIFDADVNGPTSGTWNFGTRTGVTVTGATIGNTPYETLTRLAGPFMEYAVSNLENGSWFVDIYYIEGFHTSGGQRLFHLDIQGSRVHTSYDPYTEAGGINTEVIDSHTVNVTGNQLVLRWVRDDAAPDTSAEIYAIKLSKAGVVVPANKIVDRINLGSSSSHTTGDNRTFAADDGATWTGGTAATRSGITVATDTIGDIPYQTLRRGATTGYMERVFSDLENGSDWTVNVFYIEGYWTSSGSRSFHLDIQGSRVRTDYDPYDEAGAEEDEVIDVHTGIVVADNTLTLRWTAGTFSDPKPEVYAVELIKGASSTTIVFSTQRGVLDIPTSSVSATATVTSVDTSKSLELLSGAQHTGSGRSGGTGYDDLHEFSSYLTLTNATTLTGTRPFASPGADNRLFYELLTYTGPAAGDNEFIVRYRGIISLANGVTSGTASIVGATDITKCVPFYSVSNSESAGTPLRKMAVTAEILTGTDEVKVQRVLGQDIDEVHVTVIEFVGSNWTIQQNISHTFSATAADETESITDVSDWTDCLIYPSFRYNADTPQDISITVRPGANTTTLRHRIHGGSISGQVSISHIIKNTGMTVQHIDSITGGAGGVSGQTVNYTVNAVDLDTSMLIVQATDSGVSGDRQRVCWMGRLTTATNVEMWRAYNAGAAGDVVLQVAQLPMAASSDITAPESPQNLIVTAVSADTLQATCDPAIDTESGINYYEWELDSVVQAGTTEVPQKDFTGLTEYTEYTVRVRAYDNAANVSGWSDSTVQRTADETAPTAPVINSVDVAGETQTFHITPSTDAGSGVVAYDFYDAGEFYISVAAVDFTIDGAEIVTDISSIEVPREWSVVGVDGEGNESESSVSFNAASGNAPQAPGNTDAFGGSETSINVSWGVSASATTYNLYLTSPSGTNDILIASVADTQYTETGLVAWQTRYYKVSATNANGEGPKSAVFSGRTLDLTPPAGGSINSVEQVGATAVFDITPATDAGSGVAGYYLWNDVGEIVLGEPPYAIITDANPQADISFTGATYSWTIQPFDVAGNVGTMSAAVELVAFTTYPDYPQSYDNDREPLDQVSWDRANGTLRGRVLHTKENYEFSIVHPYITDAQRQILDNFWTQNRGVIVNLVLQDTGETHQCYMRKRPKFIPIAYDGTDHSFKAIVEFIQ